MAAGMTKRNSGKNAARKAAQPKGFAESGRQAKFTGRDAKPGVEATLAARVDATIKAAQESGLISEKSSRISGRVSAELVEQAKRRTGLSSDTDLIQFALAAVALEDGFAVAFKESRGKIDPDLKLGF